MSIGSHKAAGTFVRFAPHRTQLARAMALLAGAFIAATGCDRKTPSAALTTSSFEVPKPSPTGEAGDRDAMAPLEPGETLFGRLARDAKNRPPIKPNADDVFSTLQTAGASIGQKQQTMATTYRADYCIGGYTADRALAVNVCEYGDGEAAAAGRALSKSLFRKMPTREVWSHKATTLTIIQLKPDGADLEKRIVNAYLAI
ncbi:MAG: hypothetical protein ABSC94_06675 [Polyangiaceae bacterium]|jgi:hypothetical protein